MSALPSVTQQPARIRLWDLPVRAVHWLLVVAVTTSIVSGELGGPWMTLHGRSGYAVIGLVVFRIVWGVVGSTHARFTQFAPTPGRLKAYLQGRWHGLGHNPLGALSVFALLGLLALQATTGLFSSDDIAFNGPLFGAVDDDLAYRLTAWHLRLAYGLFALIALHVAAIVFHVRVKKHDLLTPMITGWKQVRTDVHRHSMREH